MRCLLLSLVLACVATLLFSSASAHVTMLPNQAQAGAATIIAFQIPHACNATVLTNQVEIIFPINITTVVPVLKAGWTFVKNVATNGVISLLYTASAGYAVPQNAYDKIDVRITMPNLPGVKLFIPVIQYCTLDTMTAWNETTTGAAHPPPSVLLLAPTDVQYIPTQANLVATNKAVSTLNETIASTVTSTSILRSNITSAFQAIAVTSASVDKLRADIITLSQKIANVNISAPTTGVGVGGAGAGSTIVYNTLGGSTTTGSSSDFNRADTLAVISIILAGLSSLGCLYYISRYNQLETKYAYLAGQHSSKVRIKTTTTPSSTKEEMQSNGKHIEMQQVYLPTHHRPSTADHDDGAQFHD